MAKAVRDYSKGGKVALFDVRLDGHQNDCIVIQSSEWENAPTTLSGSVVLSVTDRLAVRSIKLRIYGISSVFWIDTGSANRTPPTRTSQRQEKVVYDKEWSFLPQTHSSLTLGKGNYEYFFDTVLPWDIADSVEGLPGGSIVYRMKATIERTGFAKNLSIKRHLRVIRTVSLSSYDFLLSQRVENLWPNKVEYSIEVQTTAHIIGSQIPFNIHMLPYAKGLHVVRVQAQLREYWVFSVYDTHETLISEKKGERPIETKDFPDRPDAELEEWDISGFLSIPPTLDRCTQDCETRAIKVRHRVKFVIGLGNLDGHTSEIRASVPITLVLPPDIASTGNTSSIPSSTLDHLNLSEGQAEILPSYPNRVYDRLWNGISTPPIETPGIMSPVSSVSGTPRLLSRNPSLENIRDLTRMTAVHPEDLNTRLRILEVTDSNQMRVSPPQTPAVDEDGNSLREQEEGPQGGSRSSDERRPGAGEVERPVVVRNSNGHSNYDSSFARSSYPMRRSETAPRPYGPVLGTMTPVLAHSGAMSAPMSRSASANRNMPQAQHISRPQSRVPSPRSSFEEDHNGFASLSRVPSYNTATSDHTNAEPIASGPPTYSTTVELDRRSRSVGNLLQIAEDARRPTGMIRSSSGDTLGDARHRLGSLGRLPSNGRSDSVAAGAEDGMQHIFRLRGRNH